MTSEAAPGTAYPTAVIAEDEPMLAAELKEAIETLWPALRILAVVGDGVQALQVTEKEHPDIVFLDIEMPRMNGLEVARQVSGTAHVVFVTAYQQHAIEAFDAGAVDYVLKPIQMGRLSASLKRVRERLGAAPANVDAVLKRLLTEQAQGQRRYLQWVSASRGTGVRMIMVDDICYFKADNKYTSVVEDSGESIIRKSIRELGDELDPALFWQIHRSTVVNVAAIETVLRDARGGMHLKLKRRSELLNVSEPYHSLFRQM
jgi:DNA-binding LytR/AlgR family response regulator